MFSVKYVGEPKLDKKLPIFDPSNVYQVDELLTWLETENQKWEATFNERNGNDYFSELKRRVLTL